MSAGERFVLLIIKLCFVLSYLFCRLNMQQSLTWPPSACSSCRYPVHLDFNNTLRTSPHVILNSNYFNIHNITFCFHNIRPEFINCFVLFSVLSFLGWIYSTVPYICWIYIWFSPSDRDKGFRNTIYCIYLWGPSYNCYVYNDVFVSSLCCIGTHIRSAVTDTNELKNL